MKWFRFYHEAYRNPKVQDMRPELFKFWVNFLCVASESDTRGVVASESHLRLRIGLSKPLTKRFCDELEALALLHRDDAGALHPHDWDTLQPDSDDAAKRKAAERARTYANQQNGMSRDMSRDKNVTVTSRVREEGEGDRELEREGNSPLPPSIALGPEYVSVGEFAIQLAGDVSWGSWVDRQGMCGHPAKTIRRCLEECAGAGKISQAYAAAKLRGWAKEGGPPKAKFENNGKTAVQFRPEDTTAPIKRPEMPRTPEYAQAHAMYDRMEADAKRKVATP